MNNSDTPSRNIEALDGPQSSAKYFIKQFFKKIHNAILIMSESNILI